MKSPITQSDEWGDLQKELGEKYISRKGEGYYFLAIIKNKPMSKHLYCPYGPVAEDPKSFKRAIKELYKIAQQENVIFIRIEPQLENASTYLPKDAIKSKDLNPKDTWILNLNDDKKTILTNMSQGTRTRYNNFAKKGITIEKTRDLSQINVLVNLQEKLFKTKKISMFSKEYLESELKQPFSTLYIARYHRPDGQKDKENLPKDNTVLAASLFFDHEGTRYYMQSAADMEYKKLPATVAILSTALFDAKEKGMDQFDFWGIAPDGAPKTHPWYGFTDFKKSFGGHAVHYAGTYDLVVSKSKYQLYQIMRRVNRMVRKGSTIHRS